MGLAASQARFLGITARKNSCELKSMQIAQEKLSITNQLTQISEDYQKSLDATKLVWDSDYITDGSIYDVSYDLLMQPSLLNDYSPQLLTNNKNQIVLDEQYANAIKDIIVDSKTDAAGNTINISFKNMQTGGAVRNQTNFIKFLEGLNKGGILSQIKFNNMITALGTSGSSPYYQANNGLGGEITEKFTSNSMNLPTMKDYIRQLTDPNSAYINDVEQRFADGQLLPDNYNKIKKFAQLLNFQWDVDHTYTSRPADGSTPAKTGNTRSFAEYCEKDYRLSITNSKFNLADLLEKEITLSSEDSAMMGDTLSLFIEQMYQIMSEFFAVDPSSVDQDYLNFAFTQICELNGLKWDSSTSKAISFDASKAFNTGDPASQHTGLIKNGNNYQVSLSNLVKGVITYFEKAVEGFDSGYGVESVNNKHVDNSYYVTKDPEYYYFIDNPEALGIDNETALLLDYYSQMFNQICANGWTENSLVSEPGNLKNMLKNGTLFTSTYSEMDGNFYQGPYTSNNFIAEVADEDAIVRAEAEFKTQQLKLSAKEEELDIDMQQVDAELAALTTEYDSVKQIISKSVEKGFSTLGG